MKKTIPLIAIAVAMALPLTISAQTPDYYGFENPDKTVLMEWVEDAINNNNIPFTSTGEKDAFLALIDTLYAKRDNRDWSGCATVAGYLETATAAIFGDDISSLVEDCCQVTADAYDDPYHSMIMTPTVKTSIQDGLNDGNSTLTSVEGTLTHHAKKTTEYPDGTIVTEEACTLSLVVKV